MIIVFCSKPKQYSCRLGACFYSLKIESESFVEIGELVVNEDFRKKGIAKKLVDTVLDWSVNRKHNKIRVRSNSLRNEAHIFYNRIGFQEKKNRKYLTEIVICKTHLGQIVIVKKYF